MKKRYLLTFFLFLLAGTAYPQSESVNGVTPGKVRSAAFKLSKTTNVKVSGKAGIYQYRDDEDRGDFWKSLVFYGWIVNSETRKVVWHQIDVMDKMDVDFGEFNFQDEVSLTEGTYELYFAGSFVSRDNQWSNMWDGDRFTMVSSRDDDDLKSIMPNNYFGIKEGPKYLESFSKELEITAGAEGLQRVNINEVLNSKLAGAIITFSKPEKNANMKHGFSLSGPTELRIYSIGEGVKRDIYDYSWIYDLDKHQRVWEMNDINTDYAGGDKKNLMFKGTISLPAGNYMANYVSDDSHLYDNWNAMPPTDPQFAGLTIWPASGKDKANVVPFKKPEEIKPVLQITQVSDNELRSEGMRIKSPVELRILCLGEESDDEMADRGWIVNAATHQVVWDMNDQSTERAGGADKNRMVDGTVRLDKGDYIVYYSTDDSHSFGDWNSGPPHEQDFWGITLWATRKEDVSRIEKFDPAKEKSGNTIAEILHVRNDEFNTEIFVLSKETTVRVVAIGEGDDDEMFDYAWIKDAATDKTVWKMKYENTDHAGGDKKNRRSDETLTLPKGSYKLYYKTDGSHSYRDWNAKPPYDQEQYGVSVEQKSDTK